LEAGIVSQTLSPNKRRLIYALISLILGVFFILFLHFTLAGETESVAAQLLLDYRTSNTLYPFTVQNLMWLVFFFGLGELAARLQDSQIENRQLRSSYLPEDEKTMLRAQDLGPIYQKVRNTAGSDTELFLPRLIRRIILQFQGSQSIDQANSLLNSSIELYLHEIDLRYNLLRYIMWLIPSLGFIGTVIGISLALNYAGAADPNAPDLLAELTQRLAVAFYTTLLALLQSVVLVFSLHVIQAKEEHCLNKAGQYCLDNLINRLYVA